MNSKKQLSLGVILNYVNLIIGTIIPLVYTPIMLRMLGQSEYGLFSLANSVTGYLSLLSFGMGGTIVRYIAKYRANQNKEEEERVIGLFLIIYIIISITVLIVGIILSNNLTSIFNNGLTKNEISKMHILVIIMTFNTAISFPMSVLTSIIVAHERFIYRQILNMLCAIVAPCANIIALSLGYGSIGMTIAATIVQFLILPMSGFYCFKVLNVKPRFKNMPFNILKEILVFSAFVFLGTIVDMLFWSTDKVILGMLSSTVAVAIYNVGSQFNTMMTNLSTAFSGVLTPKVTIMVTQNAKKEDFSKLFIKVGRMQYLIIALALSGFIIFGKSFINIWAGNDYKDAYYIALVTLIPLTVPLIQNTGISIVMAQNKHQFRSIAYFIIAIINVISTYLVVPYFGYMGAAICSGISYIIGQGFIMNIYYYKITKINIPLFWTNIIKMTIPICILALIFNIIVSKIIIDSWRLFFIFVILYTICYIFISYIITMNEYEKDIFRKPLLKIKGKVLGR